MCLIIINSTASEEEATVQCKLVCKTTHCTAHLEQIVYQGTPIPLLNRKTDCEVFTSERHYLQKEIPLNMSMTIHHNSTTKMPAIVSHPQLNTDSKLDLKCSKDQAISTESSTMSQLYTYQAPSERYLVLKQVPKGRQHKGGSKSSTSSSSSHRSNSGGGNRQSNTGGGSTGDRTGGGSRRSFSSGSSDSSEDDKDDDEKRRRPFQRRNKEPKSKPGFSDDDDDEATDSADEGRNQDTPNSMTLDYSPSSQKGNGETRGAHSRGGSKDRFRPSDLPSSLTKSRGSGSSSSTISVESIVISKESSRVDTAAHVPQSPVNMAVGYGIPSSAAPLDSVLESTSNQMTDKSPESTKDLTMGTPTIDSPRPLALKEAHSPGTPTAMSPEIPPTFPAENSTSAKMSLAGPVSQPAATGNLPTGSSFGTLPFETTWGWQPPVYSPFALPGGSHPGSVATTPAPTDNSGGFLRPGTTALLQATVCQESEGVLIVTVRWRNRNFSGSLIDIGHHDWAPPKLSCPYGDVQIKDLYKHKEVENQSVNVDVLEDSNNVQSKSEPIIVATDSPKKCNSPRAGKLVKQEVVLQPPTPMETECITVMASSDPSEVGQANLRTLLAKPEVDKSPYSDISDSDTEVVTEIKPSKKPPKDSKESIVPAINGFYPYKIESKPAGKGKESITTMSARLPSFGEVGRPTKGSRKEERMAAQGEEYIPDSQPSSPKERASKQTNSVDEVRTKLMSTYPAAGSGTTAIPVSMPEQDQRHNRMGVASLYGNATMIKISNSPKSHDEPSRSALHTLSDVAAALIPVNSKEKQTRRPRMTMLTQEDFIKQDSGRVGRSVSPRPISLVPKANNRRSPSPAQFSKQTIEQQAATLPPFDPVPGSQRASESSLVPSPPVVMKQGTCEWGMESTRSEDGHDSDSSGSGSLLSVNRSKPPSKKRQTKNGPGEIKTNKASREESGNGVQPQTPALAPIPSDKFNLKNIQPISPDGLHPPSGGHHMHSHKGNAGVNNKKGGMPTDTHSRLHLETKKAPVSSRDMPNSTMPGPTVGEVLKKVSGTSGNAQHGGQVTVSSGHAVIAIKEGGMAIPNTQFVKASSMANHEQEKEHHRGHRHPEERRNEHGHIPPASHHHRVHTHEAVIHVPDDRASPNKDDGKSDAYRRERKRMGADISSGQPKRHEREEHVSLRHKQIPESFTTGDGEKMDIPPEFKEIYDPHLPMTMDYQYISYINQKRMQDEQHVDGNKVKREHMFHHGSAQQEKNSHTHPRRQKSNEQLILTHGSVPGGHEAKLPRQSSGESNHRSSLTNIAAQSAHRNAKAQQNGPSVIHQIKSEPEEVRYLTVSKGEGGNIVAPVVHAIQSQAGPGRRPNQPGVRRPAPRKSEEPSIPGFRNPPFTVQSPHPHGAHAITIANYPPGVQWTTVNVGPHVEAPTVKSKHEPQETARNGETGNKKGEQAEWPRPNSSFSPVVARHGGRPSSPSHPHSSHSHHHQAHREQHLTTNRSERERESSKHQRHSFPPHQEHERRGDSERENAHAHSTQQHPRQNSSSSTSSNHSTSHPSTSTGSSRNPSKEANQQQAVAMMAQQQQLIQMQQLAALQQLHQQQQLSPNALATLQRNAAAAGGIPNAAMEEYMKHLQQQQQQYEMLQKAAIQTPAALNPQEVMQLQMQMAAQMQGMAAMDPNTAMALLVQQQQQAAQQAVQQQQQQQAQEAQAQAQAQAAQAVAAQQALFQAAAAQNSVIPFMYPIAATSGQIPQLGFYDPNALAAGVQVPFPIPNAPKRD